MYCSNCMIYLSKFKIIFVKKVTLHLCIFISTMNMMLIMLMTVMGVSAQMCPGNRDQVVWATFLKKRSIRMKEDCVQMNLSEQDNIFVQIMKSQAHLAGLSQRWCCCLFAFSNLKQTRQACHRWSTQRWWGSRLKRSSHPTFSAPDLQTVKIANNFWQNCK